MSTSIGRIGRQVARVLERAGLKVDGSLTGTSCPGSPGGTGFDGEVRAGLVEVRDANTDRWLFAVGIRETDFNLRAGIARPNETILDSWPHDASGHVDGRCFQFCHGDATREESFLDALEREARRHRVPDPETADRLAAALAAALPEADEALLRAMAMAVGTGLEPDRVEDVAARLAEVSASAALPRP